MTKKRIKQLYGVLLSISLVVAGICLIAACVGIYRSGDRAFSREAVAAAFSPIAVPVYLSLALAVGGFILDLALPSEKKKTPPAKQYGVVLEKLRQKHDLTQCDEALKAAMAAQQWQRRLHWSISAGLLAAGSIIFLVYAINPAHFHQSQINASMVSAMYWMVPCLGIPFAYSVFAAYFSGASIRKEIDLAKQAVAAGCPKAEASVAPKKKAVNWLLIGRVALLCVGIGILVYGFVAGGTLDVLTKAINICTECVGLG